MVTLHISDSLSFSTICKQPTFTTDTSICKQPTFTTDTILVPLHFFRNRPSYYLQEYELCKECAKHPEVLMVVLSNVGRVA